MRQVLRTTLLLHLKRNLSHYKNATTTQLIGIIKYSDL
jgi:hypothetical protein